MRSLVVAAALLVAAQGVSAQSGGWLDKPLLGWNLAGAAVPKAPKPKGDSPSDPRCAGAVRHPETAVEGAVTTAGWSLFSAPRVNGDTTVLLAKASMDGMCRPWDFQAFVFVARRFGGTLSPVSMDSRTDGALSEIRFLLPTSIEVVFLRYVDADPLCCPSRLTTVRYRVERGAKGPVVVPMSTRSKSTGRSR